MAVPGEAQKYFLTGQAGRRLVRKVAMGRSLREMDQL